MSDEAPHPVEAAAPRVLCELSTLSEGAPQSGGAAWRLAEPGRQLDANLVRLAPGQRVDEHVEPDLDVLLCVVTGSGTVHGADGPHDLAEGTLLWLPHGSRRSLAAGDDGMSYLTVHRRRPGMRIGHRSA